MAVSKVVFGNEPLVDLTGDTVTADTLANGVTAHDASGVQITGTLDATKPTLFAPTITESNGTVSWTNNAQNGGFPVTLTAELDGAAVTSPLTVTPSMNGKTLTVTASADNFVSASADMVLTAQFKIAAGLYTFVDKPVGDTAITQDIVFTSGGINNIYEFVRMEWYPPRDITYYKASGDYQWALDIGDWIYGYKSIDISTDQIVSADFYNWFAANTT